MTLRVPEDLRGTFSDPIYHFRRGELMRRLGEALGLGVFLPPAAVVPLVGLGEDNLCSRAFPAQQDSGDSKLPTPGAPR